LEALKRHARNFRVRGEIMLDGLVGAFQVPLPFSISFLLLFLLFLLFSSPSSPSSSFLLFHPPFPYFLHLSRKTSPI
jgi:hypothetical protein